MAEIWQTIQFDGRGIDIWRINLKASAKTLAIAEATLSRAELARARHLLLDDDRRRFIMARAALRSTLADYLGQAPASLRFSSDAQSQTTLPGASGLHFSLARAQDQAVIAVVQGARVTIDIETVNFRREGMLDLAHYFRQADSDVLAALADARKRAAFYRWQVREEAVMKALGRGGSRGLDLFATECPVAAPALIAGDPAQQTGDWALMDLDFGDCVAALMVQNTKSAAPGPALPTEPELPLMRSWNLL